MADPSERLLRFEPGRRLSLTPRLLIINLLPLLLLGGGVFYLDSYRKQLLNERYKLARVEAQITAEALAGASRERQEALLIQIGKEQTMRLRMFDAEGKLWADSFALAEPSFAFDKPGDETWQEDLARWMDRAVDTIVGADPIPDYVEPDDPDADAWPELKRAREENLTQIQLRDASDGSPVINTAAPVGLLGATLLTTRNAVDITQEVREARSTLILAVLLALFMSTLLSLYMARTIVTPLRMLASATNRVRLGRERQVEVPRLPGRRDEIGQLARAIADMTDTLRQRIDAVEHFAADVAHEIKNPLASLRSALESLGTVDDRDLRHQLNAIAAHDVRRIDRLVSEISEASRIDAELSRATFEPIDLVALAQNIVGRRETRDENGGRPVTIAQPIGGATVMGVPVRLERVIDNLLDNAVSFSPSRAPIEVVIDRADGLVTLSVSDRGPGIPEEAREKVFRRFHSDRPEDEGFGQHSGLGLAIARTIAEGHGGTLIAESRADGDEGACLVLTLPDALANRR
ncbi:Signal transduction histidine-protein kinase BaeS [Tsuneonella dongtanensis]|uniref:histidine kinase n=1 Tax=Tsuneonella dongtanensis TaxID=692370 RepID=A0A1B2AD73_9SPHN|nr:stimulus-sensing domain-containing protein [Tsuneonella dongtanensis]ANY20087.1 Signal transduction histidine-protein kinase BaeS [Tsuneonella dongtanensis]